MSAPSDPSNDKVSDAWRAKVEGTLINPDTLLATDYLNHFNEVMMMIEMLPDVPDMLPDCVGWERKTYPEHFLKIGLDYGPLAAEAYNHVPHSIKNPFELTIAQLNAVIGLTVKRAAAALGHDDMVEMRRVIEASVIVMRRLSETLQGIIHGATKTVDQEEIDAMMNTTGTSTAASAPSSDAQAAIDSLFD